MTDNLEVDMEALRAELEKRNRWKQMESFLPQPTSLEIDAAIFDALDEINSHEPCTNYTLSWVVSNQDTRWLKLVFEGASYRVTDMLVKDWAANGLDVDLGDGVALESKLGDFSSLRDSLKDTFVENLERLKTACLKYSLVSRFSPVHAGRTSRKTTISRRFSNSYKSTRV